MTDNINIARKAKSEAHSDVEQPSKQIALPMVDMSPKARFQRAREREMDQVSAFVVRLYSGAIRNDLDMAEAAKRLPSIVGTLAKNYRAMRSGQRSGEKRRKDAQETWQPHAEELARRCRDMDRSATQDEVAGYVRENWERSLPLKLSHERLVKFISKPEKIGALSRRASKAP